MKCNHFSHIVNNSDPCQMWLHYETNEYTSNIRKKYFSCLMQYLSRNKSCVCPVISLIFLNWVKTKGIHEVLSSKETLFYSWGFLPKTHSSKFFSWLAHSRTELICWEAFLIKEENDIPSTESSLRYAWTQPVTLSDKVNGNQHWQTALGSWIKLHHFVGMEVHEDWKVICIEHLQLYIMSWNKKLLRMFQIKLSTTQMCAFSVIMISKRCFSWNHTHTLPILSFLWVYNCIIYTFRVNFQSWYKRKMNFWYLIYK